MEVIKEVPVEIIKEVQVIKEIDMSQLQEMMAQTMKLRRSEASETSRTRLDGEIKEVDRRRVVSAPPVVPTPAPEPVVVVPATPDDLKKIEGVGPKISELLQKAGLTTFAKVAASTPEEIKAILEAAGPRYQVHNPKTWPTQAELAAKGDWDGLQKLQDELNGGV